MDEFLKILLALLGGGIVSWLLSAYGAKQRAKGVGAAAEVFGKATQSFKNQILKSAADKKQQIDDEETTKIRRGLTAEEVRALGRQRGE